MRIVWSDSLIGSAILILKSSTDLKLALASISRLVGLPVTLNSLSSALSKRGLGSPSSFMMAGLSERMDEIPIVVDDSLWREVSGVDMPLSDEAEEKLRDGLESAKTQPMVSMGSFSECSHELLTRGMVFPDTHWPFEDEIAYRCAVKAIAVFRPHKFVHIGDGADFLAVASHIPGSPDKQEQFQYEVDLCRERRKELDEKLAEVGCEEKHYCMGNHETRGQRFAMKHCVGLYDMLNPDGLLQLTANGWKVHPYQQQVKIDKINFVHDVGHSGKNAVSQNGMAFESSNVQGHTHYASMLYFGNAEGDTHVSATIGWLGGKRAAEYLAKVKVTRNWQHAFGVWHAESTGVSHFHIIPIINGRCVLNGQIVDGNKP